MLIIIQSNATTSQKQIRGSVVQILQKYLVGSCAFIILRWHIWNLYEDVQTPEQPSE